MSAPAPAEAHYNGTGQLYAQIEVRPYNYNDTWQTPLTDPQQNPQYGAPAGAKAEEPGPVVITVRTVEIVQVFKGGALKAGDTIW